MVYVGSQYWRAKKNGHIFSTQNEKASVELNLLARLLGVDCVMLDVYRHEGTVIFEEFHLFVFVYVYLWGLNWEEEQITLDTLDVGAPVHNGFFQTLGSHWIVRACRASFDGSFDGDLVVIEVALPKFHLLHFALCHGRRERCDFLDSAGESGVELSKERKVYGVALISTVAKLD